MTKYGDVTVNDGGGLYDNEGICEHAIGILNDAVKDLTGGQYLNFCNKVFQVAQILFNLKTGIVKDRESLENKIKELKAMNDRLQEQITGLPVEKDGANNGSN